VYELEPVICRWEESQLAVGLGGPSRALQEPAPGDTRAKPPRQASFYLPSQILSSGWAHHDRLDSDPGRAI